MRTWYAFGIYTSWDGLGRAERRKNKNFPKQPGSKKVIPQARKGELNTGGVKCIYFGITRWF
jgi:hypothetical protein